MPPNFAEFPGIAVVSTDNEGYYIEKASGVTLKNTWPGNQSVIAEASTVESLTGSYVLKKD